MDANDRISKEEFSHLVRARQAGRRTFIRMQGIDADAVDELAQETCIK